MESKLARLKPSFSSLSFAERLDLILTIRANRRISKRPPASDKPKRSSASKAPTKRSAAKLLSALTPEMAAALLAEFGGGDESPS